VKYESVAISTNKYGADRISQINICVISIIKQKILRISLFLAEELSDWDSNPCIIGLHVVTLSPNSEKE
jgi:hypothetical protein